MGQNGSVWNGRLVGWRIPTGFRASVVYHLFAPVSNQNRTPPGLAYLVADRRPVCDTRFTATEASVSWSLSAESVLASATAANRTIEVLADVATANGVDLFALLGLRNLSAFMGEVFASELSKQCPDILGANPNQDGYPDLMALTPKGAEYIAERERRGQMSAKQYWSPYPYGGVEVKATCGNTPPAEQVPKPRIGESRIRLLVSAEWKAHHRETNYLLGIFWDFVDGLPTVLAAFFRNDLTPSDWGKVVVPKEGGGKTTSVSVMKRCGVKRMGAGWLLLPADSQQRHTLCQPRVFNITEESTAKLCSSPTTG